MRFNLRFVPLFACLVFSVLTIGQDASNTIVPEAGDGIFSILRKSGINPVKYYSEFLDLNEKNIVNGSQLVSGKTYFLPNAPDSYKNMGVSIVVDSIGVKEQPIFDEELRNMKLKDSSLEKTVYYIIYSENIGGTALKESSSSFTIKLAKELLVRGARVYLLQKDSDNARSISGEDELIFSKTEFGEYASIINKKYLKNNGTYQRLLVVNDKQVDEKNLAISVHYYDKSKEGKKMASSLEDIFRKNAVKKIVSSGKISPFEDEESIYLEKNVLPSVTVIDIYSKKGAIKDGIPLRSGRTFLPEMITNGILQDYSNLSFEE